jgi:hypothetical protein
MSEGGLDGGGDGEREGSCDEGTSERFRICKSGVRASAERGTGSGSYHQERERGVDAPRCLCSKASCFCFSLSNRNFYLR